MGHPLSWRYQLDQKAGPEAGPGGWTGGLGQPPTRFRVRRTNVRAQAGSFTDLITAFALGALTPGFRPDHILVAECQLPLNQHPSSASVDLFNHAVIDRLAGQPGIVAVGITDQLPARARCASPPIPSKACPPTVGRSNLPCSQPVIGTRSSEQHQRDSDFRDHQGSTQPGMIRSPVASSRVFFQNLHSCLR